MDNTRGIDYKNTFFEYPDVTKIHGEPTLGALLTLENEIKANAVSVHTNLGGGSHGHLGLVCSPTVYGTISATAYNRPTNPGTLTVTGTTGP